MTPDERDRIHALDRAAFAAKRKRDQDRIRAKEQFGDGKPVPPTDEDPEPTKMPVAV